MTPEEPTVVAISSRTGFHPDEISRHSFPNARRGYDPDAVRQYLQSVASELQEVLDREQALRRKLADAERRAAEPELDEATLLRSVGAETAKILEAAHEAAQQVASRAEARAAEILGSAESLLSERQEAAEAAAAAISESAEANAEAVVESARQEAVALLQATRAECRRIVRQAKALRAEVLGDLAEKRRGLRVQLEELRAGRDFLLEVVESVGSAAGDLRQRVESAEHEARLAAAAAGEAAEEANEDSDLEAIAFGDEGVLAEGALGEEQEGELLADEDDSDALAASYDEVAAEDESPEEEHASSRQSVDELFARIRAERSEDDLVEVAPEGEEEGVLGNRSAHEAAVAEADEEPELPVEVEPAPTEEALSEEPGEASGESPELEGEAAELARRSEVLAPVVTKLSRALKRALQDDQNVLLDAIRHASGTPELSKLLPEEAQQGRFEEATGTLLSDAWRVGHRFLFGEEPDDEEALVAGHQVAADLAAEVSGLLRHRIAEALAELNDLSEGAAEGAGASYREWRGRRVERVAADFATRAFSEGTISGSGGARVRWVVDDEGQPCPDCDDNALAGEMTAGEEFPTGQPHPPVHSGCRCLLVLASS